MVVTHKCGNAVLRDDNVVVLHERISDGGLCTYIGINSRHNHGFDATRPKDEVQICVDNGAETMLGHNRVTGLRAQSGK